MDIQSPKEQVTHDLLKFSSVKWHFFPSSKCATLLLNVDIRLNARFTIIILFSQNYLINTYESQLNKNQQTNQFVNKKKLECSDRECATVYATTS